MHGHFTFRLDVSLRLYKCFYFVLHVFVLERPMIGTIGPPGVDPFHKCLQIQNYFVCIFKIGLP